METAPDQHKEVLGQPQLPMPTAATDGISPGEVKRLHGALHFMSTYIRQPRRGTLWLGTAPAGSSRNEMADFQRRITKVQGTCKIKQYGLWVLEAEPAIHAHYEAEPAIHAHYVFVGNQAVVGTLLRSKFFQHKSPYCNFDIRAVWDLDFLANGYLIEERNSRADYKKRYRLRRIKNADRIYGGKLEGGGDRVHLSGALQRDALAAGMINPWQKRNAKRTESRKLHPRAMLRPAGQIPLLDLPLPSRVKDFGGGFMPRPVALELEHHRVRHGLSQSELAALVGRSQGQLANALRGHDPISAPVVNRLRDVLLA
jgi:Helix-turn-helix domain